MNRARVVLLVQVLALVLVAVAAALAVAPMVVSASASAPHVRRWIHATDASGGGTLNGNAGTDRAGGDLPHSPVALSANAEPRDCALLCSSTAGCVAWSFAVSSTCSSSLTVIDGKAVAKATFVETDSGATTMTSPVCHLKSTVPRLSLSACHTSGVANASLTAPVLPRLPAGSILPRGWLARQLQLQGSGLAGHLHLFWPDVMNSSWIGGFSDAPVHNHERLPYWLNSVLAMAYINHDADLMASVDAFVDYIVEHQRADGWLGPSENYDPWPRMLILYIFQQYAELNPSDARIIPAMFKYLEFLQAQMLAPGWNMQDYMWTYIRTQDMLTSIYWLYDNFPSGHEQFLLDVAETLFTTGWDWKNYYLTELPHGDTGHTWSYYNHGVNNGMALKSAAVWYRQSHNQSDIDSSYQRVAAVDMYHGQASGVFACDECLAGLNPSRGTELCTVVEIMYSYSTMLSILGDPYWGDRVERAAFNALPGSVTADTWAHQYLQQSNQVNSMPTDDAWWGTDGGWSGVFGLAPNYGCCTVNFGQGWTKFVTSMYMVQPQAKSTGLVAALLGPSEVNVVLDDPTYGNNTVSVVQDTDYPFGINPVLNFTITADYAFPFSVRIPGWAVGAYVTLPDGTQQPATNGTLFTYQYPVSSQGKSVMIQVTLPTQFSLTRRYNNAASVYYGPFLMAMDLDFYSIELNRYAFLSRDWGYLPTQEWRFGVLLNESLPDFGLSIKQQPVPDMPWNHASPPLVATAMARVIDWPTQHSGASPPPQSPVSSTEPLQPITLLPFGTSKLRIAELPTLVA